MAALAINGPMAWNLILGFIQKKVSIVTKRDSK